MTWIRIRIQFKWILSTGFYQCSAVLGTYFIRVLDSSGRQMDLDPDQDLNQKCFLSFAISLAVSEIA